MSIYDMSGKRIWLTGHRGMLGSALCRALQPRSDITLLTASRDALDLRDQTAVTDWVAAHRPQVVLLVAAKNGGILANRNFPAEFLYDNLMIATNVMQASHRGDVEKLLFVGSSTIYPRLAEQPISEDAVLTGPLEPTHEGYALAKIAGIKLCQAYRRQYGRDYIAAVPSNLYGPNDNFDLATSSVLPALLRRFHEASETGAETVVLWGSGRARREFVYVDDLADALLFLLERYSDDGHINVGAGNDIEIRELAALIGDIVGFKGRVEYDTSKPDGTMRKLMDSSRLNALGWTPRISLRDGIAQTHRWFLQSQTHMRGG